MNGECIKQPCRSPLACEGWGYCRERNMNMEMLLADPLAVHLNMLRGSIAKPHIDHIIHLYGKEALLIALGVEVVSA